MRDRFEIVHLREDGSVQILQRSIPRDRRDRFTQCENYARLLLRGRIEKSWLEGLERDLTYAYMSEDHPEDGIIGIREKQ